MNQLIMGAMLLTWCAGTLAGCATIEKRASFQVKPITTTAASSENIYLTISNDNWNASDYAKTLYA
jgi:hypothetical protein